VVAEKAMDVYVEDMSKPLLKVRDLKRDPESGMLGFWTLLGGAWFANLNYQPMEQAPPSPKPWKYGFLQWEPLSNGRFLRPSMPRTWLLTIYWMNSPDWPHWNGKPCRWNIPELSIWPRSPR
jgi:hypothetical protein